MNVETGIIRSSEIKKKLKITLQKNIKLFNELERNSLKVK